MIISSDCIVLYGWPRCLDSGLLTHKSWGNYNEDTSSLECTSAPPHQHHVLVCRCLQNFWRGSQAATSASVGGWRWAELCPVFASYIDDLAGFALVLVWGTHLICVLICTSSRTVDHNSLGCSRIISSTYYSTRTRENIYSPLQSCTIPYNMVIHDTKWTSIIKKYFRFERIVISTTATIYQRVPGFNARCWQFLFIHQQVEL